MSALKIKVNVKGNKELAVRFGLMAGLIKAGMPFAWIKIGMSLHRKILAMVPVDTGKLLRSTTPKYGYMRVTSIASAINPRDGFNYARKQHDGGRVGQRYGGYVPGKFYMTVPLMMTEPEVVGIIDEEIAKIIAIAGLG